MSSIFLSHSWIDKFFVRKLAEKLRDEGVTVWIDEAELRIGDSLIAKITDAIKKADFVGAILSHTSVSSSWVQQELQQAMTMEITGKTIKVLPILIEKCELPEYLKHKKYADFTDPQNFDAPFMQLLQVLGVSKLTALPSKKPILVFTHPKSKQTPSNLETFEDINITGTDKNKLYKPDPEMSLYNVYFSLSRRPTQEWVQIFEAERRFPRHTMWRKAWIDGQYVVVHCGLDEIKKYHLEDIKQDVASTNVKYREYLQQQAINKQKEMIRKDKQRRQIDDALDGLEFE
jgi:hypothetical protein